MRRFFALTSVLFQITAAPTTLAEESALFSWLPVVAPGDHSQEQSRSGCGSAACKTLQKQLEAGCQHTDGSPYADTIYLRQNTKIALTEEESQLISLSMLSADTKQGLRLIDPLLKHEDESVQYAAALHGALLFYRAGSSLLARDATELRLTMRSTASDAKVPDSDYKFFEALAALERGQRSHAVRLLKQANIVEPGFFNALLVRLKLELEIVSETQHLGRNICLKNYTELLDVMSKLVEIERCSKNAAHIDLLIARGMTSPDNNAAYNVSKVYLALIAGRIDIAKTARNIFAENNVPSCRSNILAQLDELINTASKAQP